MAFKDLDEFLEPYIELPISGKVYRVKSVDAKTGLWCQRLANIGISALAGAEVSDADKASLELDDDEERNLYQRVLGDTYDEMIANGLPFEPIKHAGVTAYLWTIGDRARAEDYWASPGKGRPEPKDRLPKKKSAPRASRAGSTKKR